MIQICSTSGSSRCRCSGPNPATASYTARAAVAGSASGGNDALEWYFGIFAEDHPGDGFLGSLLTLMVGHDAFPQVLTNPLLAPQVHTASTFTAAGLEVIEQTGSLQDVVERNVADPSEVLASFRWRPAVGRQEAPSAGPAERPEVPRPRSPRSARQRTAAADPPTGP